MLKKSFRKVKLHKTSFYSDQRLAISNETLPKLVKRKRYYSKYVPKRNCLDNAVIENFFETIKSKYFIPESLVPFKNLRKEIEVYSLLQQ